MTKDEMVLWCIVKDTRKDTLTKELMSEGIPSFIVKETTFRHDKVYIFKIDLPEEEPMITARWIEGLVEELNEEGE